MHRQKKKPDSVKLNFVRSREGRRRGITIESVRYPLCQTPSVQQTGSIEPSHDRTDDLYAECESEVHEQSVFHKHRKERAAEAWAEVRTKVFTGLVLGSGFLKGAVCVFCTSPSAHVWCPDCGANAYFCEQCATKLHSSFNIFHSPLL